MTHQVGDQPIEGYTLEESLGRGTYGEAWKAQGPDAVPCVMKFIPLVGISPRELRFPRMLLSLRHPNLCPILGAWVLDGSGKLMTSGASESINLSGQLNVCLVVASAMGQKSLAQRLEECRNQGGIPIRELIRNMEDAARGIDHLHNPGEGLVGLVHGNIKPSNLLLVGGLVQVTDFGLSRLDMSAGSTRTFSAAAPLYTAPESMSEEPNKASDQYSLAICYYHLRTGQLPFEESKALISHLTGVLDFTQLGDSERRVLDRATHKTPGNRYLTCSDMVAALRQAVERGRDWQRDGEPRAESSSRRPGAEATPRLPAPPAPSLPPPDLRTTGSFSDDIPDLVEARRNLARAREQQAVQTAPAPAPAAPAPRKSTQPDLPRQADGASPWKVAQSNPTAGLISSKVQGQATVRYYSQMNPDKLFPLLVAFSEKQLREIVKKSVRQAVSSPITAEEGSLLEVEPILPGCEVYPPLAGITVRAESVTQKATELASAPARFYVLPRVLGRVEDARVVIRQDGVILAEVPLQITIRRQRLAMLMGAFGLVSPYVMSGMKLLGAQPEATAKPGIDWYYQGGNWFVNNVRPEWVLGFCLLLAIGLYFWCRPRQKSTFWDLEKAS